MVCPRLRGSRGIDEYFRWFLLWCIGLEGSCGGGSRIPLGLVWVDLNVIYTVGFCGGNVHDCDVSIVMGVQVPYYT